MSTYRFLDANAAASSLGFGSLMAALQFSNALPKNILRSPKVAVVNLAAARTHPGSFGQL